MKVKSFIKILIIYCIILCAIAIVLNKLELVDNIIRYIKFDTITFKFQDLLSVSINLITILVGAVITVATVLISMCDKRVIKLIDKYEKSGYLISTIKISIATGFFSVILLAIIYARLDYNILIIRLILLFISGILLLIFFHRSNILLKIILMLLKDSFKGEDSLIVESEFKKPIK